MIQAFCLALRDLADPAIRRFVWTGVFASLVGLALLVAGVEAVLLESRLFDTSWLDVGIDVVGGLGVAVIAFFLFPVVAAAIAGLLGDAVVSAVERRRYPELPNPPHSGSDFVSTLRFLGLVLAINILILPVHLLPGVNLLVFGVINGYLLGREYFEQVAARRLDADSVRAMRRQHTIVLLMAGLIVAFLLAVPVVNLVAPVFASAFLTHLFWSLTKRA